MSVRSSFDAQAMAQLVQRPGIDPRLWLVLAVVEELGVDPDNGVYADVRLLPSGDKWTCLVASGYAGNGFGAWLPLLKEDIVLVAVPRGDPGEGPIVIARIWTGSDKPPAELGTANGDDPPTSPVVVVGEGQTVRVVCRAGATVEIVSDTGVAVPVALAPAVDANYTQLKDALDIVVGKLNALDSTATAAWDSAMAGWPTAVAAERLKGE